MAIQQTTNIELTLQGDGVATTFTYSFSKLFQMQFDLGVLINPGTLPTSVTFIQVTASGNPTLPSCVASLDGFGNLILTFGAALPAGVIVTAVVQLNFNSGTLQGTTAAWNSGTTLNTTWTLPLNGSPTVLVPFVVSGTVTGGVISFQASVDGATWFPVQGMLPTGFQTSTTWTSAIGSNAFLFNTSGYAYLRMNLATLISGAGSVTFIMQGASQVAQAQIVAGVAATYNSTAPTTVAGAAGPLQTDGYGNLYVNEVRRSQVIAATGNIASITAANIIAAQGAGIFADLAALVLTLREGTTANIFFGVNISDGTKTYRFNFMSQDVTTFQAGAPLTINFDPPLPATNANTAWTIALTSATDAPSVDYVCTFIKQQAG
jgi:hypothetical protein